MINSTRFQVSSLLLYLILSFFFLLSCEKSPIRILDSADSSTEQITEAKLFSESQTNHYKFVTTYSKHTKSSPQDISLTFDWSNPILVNREYTSAVEVPLIKNTEKNVYVRESLSDKITLNGQYNSTTRLIVRYDKQTKQYEQFIITKIWYNGIKENINTLSFNDLHCDALTVIYDVEGNVLSEHKKKGIYYTFHSMQSDSLSKDNYLLISEKEINPEILSTKSISQDEDNVYKCTSCNEYCPSFVCNKCGGTAELEILDIEVAGGIGLVKEICQIYAGAIAYGISEHSCGRLCYGRMIDVVAREFSLLAFNLPPMSLSEDIYLLSSTYNPSLIRNHEAAELYSKWGATRLRVVKESPFGMYADAARLACARACSQTPGGGGTTGGGGTNPPNPDPNPNPTCHHEKCPNPQCGGCLNAGWTACRQCQCEPHIHGICDYCERCIKFDDICNKNSSLTRSAIHTINCANCNCWNEINDGTYVTREERARTQLAFLKVRGAREFAEDIENLLNNLRDAGARMSDVYPIYDMVESEFLKLKGTYMITIARPFIETALLIVDLAFLKTDVEDIFFLYQNMIKKKIGYEISLSAWKGRKGSYFEPLGKGSSAKLPDRANLVSLEEELTVKEIKTNPYIYESIIYDVDKMTDTRWLGTEGWKKCAYTKRLSNGEQIHVHYNALFKSNIIKEIDDIKIKL